MGQDAIRISTIEDFKQLNYQIIPVYTMNGNEQICLNVKVKKASLTDMMASGIIPDTLLATAQSLRNPDGTVVDENKMLEKLQGGKLQELLAMQRKVAKELLVEPSYDEVEEFIDDDMCAQLMTYATGGLKDLERFHTKQGYIGNNISSQRI